MNWKLIIGLCLLNLIVGLLTILGLLGTGATWIGLLVLLLMALLLGKFAGQKFFMHGFLTGLIGGILGGLLQIALYDTYVANNPQVAEGMDKLREFFPTFDMRWLTLMFAPLGAAFNGVILGVLAILGGKIFGPKPQPAAASESTDDGTPRP
jgi:hypothetical protein